MRNYVIMSFISIFAAMFPTASKAQDLDWQSAIIRVEKSALKYSDYALKKLGSTWVGQANDSIKFETHRCAILGRMLGVPEAIQHIENFEYPSLNSASDAFEMLVFSLTLENWVAAARSSLKMNQDERKNTWNLDCVGQFGIAAELFIKSDKSNATFSLNDRTLFVYGDIDLGFYKRLKLQLQSNPRIEEVSLGSGGGSVRDALLAGYEIRRLGLNTTIHGNCFSACPLVFMGGVKRVLWAAPHRLGFHQIYTGDGHAISEDDLIYDIARRYMNEMGISSQTVISWMLSSRPSEMFEPDVSKLCEPKVSTFVQRICGF